MDLIIPSGDEPYYKGRAVRHNGPEWVKTASCRKAKRLFVARRRQGSELKRRQESVKSKKVSGAKELYRCQRRFTTDGQDFTARESLSESPFHVSNHRFVLQGVGVG